jgi:hypothetical protein
VNAPALQDLVEHANFERDPRALSIIRISHFELWLRDLERRSQTVRHAAAVNFSSSITGNGRARVAEAFPAEIIKIGRPQDVILGSSKGLPFDDSPVQGLRDDPTQDDE